MPFRFGSRQNKEQRKPTAEEKEGLAMRNPAEGKFIMYFPEDGTHAAYWKVSSSTGTTRVFGDRTDTVPDTSQRRGETDNQWRLRMLVRDIQAMASDPETFIAAYDARVPAVTDLVNDFLIRLEFMSSALEKGAITQETWSRLRVIEARVKQIPDLNDASLSKLGSLRDRSDWTEVASLAREVLESSGYVLEPPPPRSMSTPRWSKLSA